MFRTLPASEQIRRVSDLTDAEAEALLFDWEWNARPKQLTPPEPWQYWLILAGRGFGKTRTGAEQVRIWVKKYPYVNLIGATLDDARDIMIEGESGILAICPKDERPQYVKRQLRWPNGAKSLVFTADEPERLRGKQHMKLWCLTGDTQVMMADGTEKPLAEVAIGDMVHTRSGARAVTGQALTKRDARIYCLQTVGGRNIIGTADHPVWVNGQGFVALGSLKQGMSVCAVSVSNGAERLGIAIKAAITSPPSDFIGKCGNQSTALSQRDSTCITSMRIKATTQSIILNCCRTANTVLGTPIKSSLRTGKRPELTVSRYAGLTAKKDWNASSSAYNAAVNIAAGQKHLSGIVLLPALSGHAPRHSKVSGESANSAPSITQQQNGLSDIALGYAIGSLAKNGLLRCIYALSNVLSARNHSQPREATLNSAHADVLSTITDTIASVEKLDWRADVYDISVDGAREFFANGILVHNCDELAAWRYPEAWDQAILGLRLGDNPQAVITTTPKPTKLVKELAADPDTYITTGSTYENKANLAPTFLGTLVKKYEGTRLGRQELNAELLGDNPGALWKRSDIDSLRVKVAPAMKRIVVAIDPAVTGNADSDETGITVNGLGSDDHGYVLADLSMRGTPDEWARVAVNAYHDWKADRIIGETNNGGDMIETVIRMVDKNVSYKAVHASRGKMTRAEPISALYEQKRCHHVGFFPVLEDQMCDYDPNTSKYSPDRMDANVWGFTELMTEMKPGAGWLQYYAELAAESKTN